MAVGIVLMAGIILLIVDYMSASTRTVGKIVRNGHGQGARTEVLEVLLEGGAEKIPVEIKVSEQQYDKDEVRELFQRVMRRMDRLILGENDSLDRVEHDMNLVTQVPGEPVEVEWELDRYDVMNVRGELQKKALDKEGTLIKLSAVLTYSEDRKEQALYECMANVFPETLSGRRQKEQQIRQEIMEQEEESKSKKIWLLPEKIQGKAASYYKKMDYRGLVLIVMSLLIAVLLYALEQQNMRKKREEKKQQMMLDYPEIVNKLTLFLGAGMTVKRAWRKVVEDYEHHKADGAVRYAYEEMKKACYEMESGVMETESYENFGRRCNVQAYIRLGALLSQNLRKGTKGLTHLLRLESIQAFEERKARAKRLGEEAGTKLLLPMFLMLAIVLIIVIVPAFLSMQI